MEGWWWIMAWCLLSSSWSSFVVLFQHVLKPCVQLWLFSFFFSLSLLFILNSRFSFFFFFSFQYDTETVSLKAKDVDMAEKWCENLTARRDLFAQHVPKESDVVRIRRGTWVVVVVGCWLLLLFVGQWIRVYRLLCEKILDDECVVSLWLLFFSSTSTFPRSLLLLTLRLYAKHIHTVTWPKLSNIKNKK